MRILLALSAFSLMAVSAPASANMAKDKVSPLTPIYACQDIADNAQRLACYDNAASQLKSKESTGEIAAVNRAEIEAVERDSFGLSLPSLPKVFGNNATGENRDRDGQLAEVDLQVKSLSRSARGKLRVTMQNGQVWEQTDSLVKNYRSASTATIKRGVMGSFKIKLDGKKAFKAKRVK